MADVKIVYDEERITVGDLLDAEEEDTISANMKVLAKVVMNGDGEYLPEDEGFEALRQFSLADIRSASEKIREVAQGQDSPK